MLALASYNLEAFLASSHLGIWLYWIDGNSVLTGAFYFQHTVLYKTLNSCNLAPDPRQSQASAHQFPAWAAQPSRWTKLRALSANILEAWLWA